LPGGGAGKVGRGAELPAKGTTLFTAHERAGQSRWAPDRVAPRRTRIGCVVAVTPNRRRRRGDRADDAAATQDVWRVLVRARTDGASGASAAARDAVFRWYLPMARALANDPGPESRPVDPATAEQAAELGLAQAVLGWRRPDSHGFEAFALAAVAARLRCLPTAHPDEPPPG
jgi:hypothetical protein